MRPQLNNRIARLSLRNLSLPNGFSALKHRNYRLYFFGQAVSVTGTWMQSLAMSWLVLSLTSPLSSWPWSMCCSSPPRSFSASSPA